MILSLAYLAMCHEASAQNLRRPPVDPQEAEMLTAPPVHVQTPRTIGLGQFQANMNGKLNAFPPREPAQSSLKPLSKPSPQENERVTAPILQRQEPPASLPQGVMETIASQASPDGTPYTLPLKREREIFAPRFEEASVLTRAEETAKSGNPTPEQPAKGIVPTNTKKADANNPEQDNALRLTKTGEKEDETKSSKSQTSSMSLLANKDTPKSAPEKPESLLPTSTKPETSTPDPDRVVYVVDQDLRQFLTDFSRRFGMRADIAQTVRGRLTKVKLPVDPTALLKELERRFDLEWLIEGDLLKVTARSDLATRIIPLGPLSYEEVIRELKVIDIDTTRYPLRKLSESNSIITTAPTGHIGRVMAMIEALRAGKSIGPDLRIVKFGSSQKVSWD